MSEIKLVLSEYFRSRSVDLDDTLHVYNVVTSNSVVTVSDKRVTDQNRVPGSDHHGSDGLYRADILRGQMIKMNSHGSQGSQVSQGGGSGSNTTTPISNTTVTPGSMIPKPSPRKNIVQRGQSQSPR